MKMNYTLSFLPVGLSRKISSAIHRSCRETAYCIFLRCSLQLEVVEAVKSTVTLRSKDAAKSEQACIWPGHTDLK